MALPDEHLATLVVRPAALPASLEVRCVWRFRATLQKNIGIFPTRSLKMPPKTPNAS
jgi:hypothetical protein